MSRVAEITSLVLLLGPFTSIGASAPAPSVTIYVDADAPPGGNGFSWGSAYQDLQPAIQLAYFSGGTITEIWVAEGTYTPSAQPPGGGPSKTFWMVDGVSMYGGFEGYESDVGQRDIAAHPTILSGDVNGTPTNINDDAYHVLLNNEIDVSIGLDGFEITRGNASGTSDQDMQGGGLYVERAVNLVIANCRFYQNRAQGDGGALQFRGSSPSPSTILIQSCTFLQNTSVDGTAGMNSKTSQLTSYEIVDCWFEANHTQHGSGGARVWLQDHNTPVLIKGCTFLQNVGYGACDVYGCYADGGGMRVLGYAHVAQCAFLGNGISAIGGGGGFALWGRGTITQCIFSGNAAPLEGGGLYCHPYPESLNPRDIYVDGCTFSGNHSSDGGAVFVDLDPVHITNSILWGDGAGVGPEIGEENGMSPDVRYCDIEGGWTDTGDINADPLFFDADGPDGAAGTLDDDLSLSPSSPCVDAGSNSALLADAADLDEDNDLWERTPLDYAGGVRRGDVSAVADTGEGTAPIVDMGALEVPGDCGSVTGYCSTSPNSVGQGALISHAGSVSVTASDLVLQASICPPNQFGLFYYGRAQLSVPFGNGLRCVGGGGGQTYRFAPVQSDGWGLVSMPIDFGAPPAGSGSGALLPFEEWNFQYWYRDPAGGGAQFNTSDGLNVVFCP